MTATMSATTAPITTPYLGERHVAFAARLRSWRDANAHLWSGGQEVAARCTAIVRQLGADGLLDFLAQDEPWDFREICLARDLLANADDLADFAYSIQALSARPLARYGSPGQRERWLRPMAQGHQLGSLAISEPGAGSDLGALTLTADETASGWILHGCKCWIANAPIADVHTVIARTGDGPGLFGLSAFLVPAETPGLRVEQVDLVAPRPFGTLVLDGCELPRDALLGSRGQGFAIAMGVLEHFRMTVGAAAVGLARRAADEALAYAAGRVIGGRRLIDFDTTRASLAEMQTHLCAAWLLVLQAAWQHDAGGPRYARQSSIAKLHATETAQHVVDGAVQLLGASGVVSGSVTEALYRQVRLLRIYEGTSEVQRATIAGQLDFGGLTATGGTR